MKKSLSSEQSIKFFKIFKIVVLSIACIATVLRVLALFLFYEADIGYYKSGSIVPTIFNVIMVLAAIFILAYCIILGKNSPCSEKYTVSSKCSAVFVALAFGGGAISYMFSLYEYMQYSIEPNMSLFSSLINLLTIIAPAIACAYFVLYALGKSSPAISLMGGIFALIYFVILLATSYFDIYVQMNAPEKLSVHLCSICTLVLILSEMRLMCGVEKKAFYLFSVAFSAIALTACALPTIIASFGGVFTEGIIAPPDVSSYIFFALGIFSVVRLIMLEPKMDMPDNEEILKEDTKNTDDLTDISIESESKE